MTDKDERTKITLIGKALAQEGAEFVYEGEVHECEGCRLRKVCHNLLPHRRYRIVGVRTATLHSCPVHMDGAYTVEVVESAVPAAVSAERAILNSTIVYETGCTHSDCVSFALCNPEGIVPGEGYRIAEIDNEFVVSCELGKRMKRVLLSPF
ncbi:UPF0179 family protein [Methanogenium sp. MK-MG]|uniref:UPF0179 family protein n=1 Tax=Methanogenium sp. MK-MG TaxID=2599926 RepID=UPI0013ED9AC1|nr:UPF0179 family protein [Methanogenium sp. MK-MG]KAF1078923.1 hypothetical protein MKMG_00192 [Methanogenium sp. MK-MG]